ncbi:SHOCT domain-containing protein [Pararhizobium sp. LjRoot255]|jgi:hypothetical protein|uniref:SHOCT domain-containing protein n=1 Tax=Pararhizobium sp. LjRoot255 TaxID=3342298 RepID=UPI003ECE6946
MMKKSGKAAMVRMVAACGAVGLTLVLAGCSSATVDEQPSIYSATMAKPIPADVYPVIEGKRPAASAQMSNEEAAAQEARLTALSSARTSGNISEAEYQRRLKELQLLAANHGTDTLKQIEN